MRGNDWLRLRDIVRESSWRCRFGIKPIPVFESEQLPTAHKLARIIYAMLRYGQQYVDAGAEYYESQYHERALRAAKRRAAQLGYELVPVSDSPTQALDLPLATATTSA